MKKNKNPYQTANRLCAAIASLLVAGGSSAQAQTLIYSDTFPTSTYGTGQQLDGAPTTGISGVDGGASGALPLSAAYEQQLTGYNSLQLADGGSGDSGYVRFDTIGASSTLYNWASSPGGSLITAAGGFTVSFNWVAPNSSSDWIYFAAGADPADTFGYNYSLQPLSSKTASGIILADNGTVQVFSQGAGGPGGSFTPQLVNTVNLTYQFSSWNAGAPVTLSATVDGTPVISGDAFTWASANAGANYLDLGAYQSATGIISDFQVSTVPEPSTWAMMAGGLGFLLAKRRFIRM